ncbi:peptidoglycan DD-metalloendopeptidase family protein [Novosphingobium sp.]|uniref:murein hydrolase activator EnvC family protein n=1 Tax=Novosphingobium sp. TaxID=1874826 RepID=UPI0025D73E44|nr:peptidoglycan DD-metalloendopeptidase family protein [Novosphingobium sp.]
MTRYKIILTFALGVAMAASLAGWRASAENAVPFASSQEAAAALDEAQAQLDTARNRGEALEAQANAATAAAERTERQAAAVAARIQESQAQAAIYRAKLALLDQRQTNLRLTMATRQAPLVRLTAALELIARRPPIFGLLRPGSLRDTVYLRAVLTTMAPEVQRRTEGLRGEIDKARALRQQQSATIESLRASTGVLAERQRTLAELQGRQRLASQQAQSNAVRETDRALALAEQTRDLGGLMAQLDSENALRDELSALPGPIMRPANPQARAGMAAAQVEPAPIMDANKGLDWILPVAGRLGSGFGSHGDSGSSRGIMLLPQPGALVIAPAGGRVAFAGPYRGYGRIMIIEHPGGWATLITGLARIDSSVGDELRQGAPIGLAASGRSAISVELRKDGVPVNPLGLLR